ncbi:hypothetical protein [Pseudomonas syringae]|uniref:hypothetical protein n=1 Tax=Pseudomonas syringae TaxID=317 RepID=UPI003F772591
MAVCNVCGVVTGRVFTEGAAALTNATSNTSWLDRSAADTVTFAAEGVGVGIGVDVDDDVGGDVGGVDTWSA